MPKQPDHDLDEERARWRAWRTLEQFIDSAPEPVPVCIDDHAASPSTRPAAA